MDEASGLFSLALYQRLRSTPSFVDGLTHIVKVPMEIIATCTHLANGDQFNGFVGSSSPSQETTLS